MRDLKSKYNEKFVASHIGQRYGTATNDTITTILHPEGKENISFKELILNRKTTNMFKQQKNIVNFQPLHMIMIVKYVDNIDAVADANALTLFFIWIRDIKIKSIHDMKEGYLCIKNLWLSPWDYPYY